MAKTSLLRSLQRFAAQYRQARAWRLPLHAIRAWCAAAPQTTPTHPAEVARRFSRRTFLTRAGIMATALALPRSTHIINMPRIAIVGGGIAGLTCALTLADHGIAATVYEAAGRIGGRMFSNTSGYWDEGQVSEWCGEFIDTNHYTMRGLAQRFGLQLDDVLMARPPDSEDTYAFFGSYYPQAQVEADFAPVFTAVMADLEAAGYPTTYKIFTPAGDVLSKMSIYEWIESRVPGGHTSPLGQLLDVACASEYGTDTTDQAALNLVYLLGFPSDSGALSLFGTADERFHIRGGNQQLPQAMAEQLGIGETVQLGMPLVRLQQTPGGQYRLWFERGAATTEISADYVVLALPFAVLRHLDYSQAGFDRLKEQAIQELGCGRHGKLHAQFTARLWDQTGPWPGLSSGSSYADTGYQSTWDATRAQPAHSGILTFYAGGTAADALQTPIAFATAANPRVTADAWAALRQVEPVFPGLSALWNGKATQALSHKSPLFRVSYVYYRVGQYTAFGGYEQVRQGGVLFCGEHTSVDFQGSMEGGAAEGERAARQLIRLIFG